MRRTALATFVRYWLPVILWFGIISLFSTMAFASSVTILPLERLLQWLIPGVSRATVLLLHSLVRKSAHFVEFFVLGLLIYRAFRRGVPQLWRTAWALQTWALAASLALLDEFHQRFVPDRTSSLADSALDTLGALSALLFLYLRMRAQRNAISTAAMRETLEEK